MLLESEKFPLSVATFSATEVNRHPALGVSVKRGAGAGAGAGVGVGVGVGVNFFSFLLFPFFSVFNLNADLSIYP